MTSTALITYVEYSAALRSGSLYSEREPGCALVYCFPARRCPDRVGAGIPINEGCAPLSLCGELPATRACGIAT